MTKPIVALLRVFDEPTSTNLEPVTVISGPDHEGMVQVNREIHGTHGPTDRWHVSRLYKFDPDLMDKVNTLANRAVDAQCAAVQILNAEGELLFDDDQIMKGVLENMPADHPTH